MNTNRENVQVINENNRIFIVDKTDKKWDVTHAVNEYGFDLGQFEFGSGPFAIQPILDPKMLNRGDPGYPGQNEEFLVLGVKINDEARAYPLDLLFSHEVADDRFDSLYVAAAF